MFWAKFQFHSQPATVRKYRDYCLCENFSKKLQRVLLKQARHWMFQRKKKLKNNCHASESRSNALISVFSSSRAITVFTFAYMIVNANRTSLISVELIKICCILRNSTKLSTLTKYLKSWTQRWNHSIVDQKLFRWQNGKHGLLFKCGVRFAFCQKFRPQFLPTGFIKYPVRTYTNVCVWSFLISHMHAPVVLFWNIFYNADFLLALL